MFKSNLCLRVICVLRVICILRVVDIHSSPLMMMLWSILKAI